MKKILILNGAGKKNGNTAAMVKTFTDAARANGNEITEFFLHDMDIAGCIDCNECRQKDKSDPRLPSLYHEISDVLIQASINFN